MKVDAEECLRRLRNQKLVPIDDLPKAVGVYALADHTGELHYIGITAARSFSDRIYSRHVNGSEERSHKLACNYNIGRMWRDRKCNEHAPIDAKIAKDLRREFIRRHCLATCVPLELTKQKLEIIEKEIFRLAPPGMISWNNTSKRVNLLPEPRDLVDALIEELGLSSVEREALNRQAALFEKLARCNDLVRHEPVLLRDKAVKTPKALVTGDAMEQRLETTGGIIDPPGSLAYERIAPDGERYVAHRFKDGFYRMADPAHGKKKHHAENQLILTLGEISEYLRKGYLLRMRGEITGQVNLISSAKIRRVY